MAQFHLDSLTEYTDKAILEELQRVAALHREGPLTTTAFDKLSPKVSVHTLQRRFGGWKKALHAAGLIHLHVENHMPYRKKIQRGKGMSNGELIIEIQRVHSLIGGSALNAKDFDRVSVTHSDICRQRFGVWKFALAKAGITQSKLGTRYTDDQCFENLAAVWTHYGRAPKIREMSIAPSTVRPKAYVSRWGTWRKSLKAFVDWANVEGKAATSEIEIVEKDPRKPAINRTARKEKDCREIRPGLRFKVFLRDRFRCLTCGRSPATHLHVVLHADHVISVHDGGKTVFENLQTLCQDCNLGKGRTSI